MGRRKFTIVGWVVSLSLLGAASPARPQEAASAGADEAAERRFLGRVRQLTFEGRRAGEGYFSPDGTRLVFQSERDPANPFFQIFELDLTTGESRRVSPGGGKATCAFYQPGTGRILFASTHHDPESPRLQREELERRAAGNERRYEWDFDPEMDLYVEQSPGGELRRLTTSRGYDAEASYAPDGSTIVFSSTRQAFERELPETEARRLETDASYFAEIYVMSADGSGVTRLTEAAGYDGGPFFSPDGERIVWRRFDPDGVVADLWSMRPDGSDKRQLTDFGSMSWAPYPHPSGEYVVFTSNKQGFANFELFVVDTGGTKQPVRITYTPGFDGLPVPTPDGRRLAWTSTRRGGTSQILIADWNHEAVLDALDRAPGRAPAEDPRP